MFEEEEDSANHVSPYMRQSRIVRRFNLETPLPKSPMCPPKERYGPDFWERIARQPSVHTVGVPGIMSGYPAWRTGIDWSSLTPSTREPLPPPSELCPARRRKKRSELMEHRNRVSVQQHIEELRKKQSNIDRVKAMTWGVRRVYELDVKEEILPEPSGAETLRKPRVHFFPTNQDDCRAEDSRFLSLSLPCASPRVAFPWMPPGDRVTPCSLDSGLEEWRAVSSFFQNKD